MQKIINLVRTPLSKIAYTGTQLEYVISRNFLYPRYSNTHPSILSMSQQSIQYLNTMRVSDNHGSCSGYRHSEDTDKPILYATLSALLLKNLLGIVDTDTESEINLVLQYQSQDGLFRDPVINCPAAESEDWWGWKHLTLHALMTLALYNKKAKFNLSFLDYFYIDDNFENFLYSLDWGKNVDFTSNTVQNIGVMLQYSRDYLNNPRAGFLLSKLFDILNTKQSRTSGLFGESWNNPIDLSRGVQASYHFWLLYFYDSQEIHYHDKIIDNLLKTQNHFGGYGFSWNSSACEDIDTIDPLVRLSRLSDYRSNDIQKSLLKSLPSVCFNYNHDGSWVFRRHEELTVVHPQMYSGKDHGNMFYTWFRWLGLAYLIEGLDDKPEGFEIKWNFQKAPGHQFF